MFQLKNKGIDSEVGDKWNLTLTVRDMYNLDRQYWPLIDVAKLFCALLVVMIHCVEIQQGHLIAILYCTLLFWPSGSFLYDCVWLFCDKKD